MIRHLLSTSMEKYIILIRIGLKQFEKNEAKKCIQYLTQGWEPIIYITKIVDVKKRREILGK